jgi:hypothetical protein
MLVNDRSPSSAPYTGVVESAPARSFKEAFPIYVLPAEDALNQPINPDQRFKFKAIVLTGVLAAGFVTAVVGVTTFGSLAVFGVALLVTYVASTLLVNLIKRKESIDLNNLRLGIARQCDFIREQIHKVIDSQGSDSEKIDGITQLLNAQKVLIDGKFKMYIDHFNACEYSYKKIRRECSENLKKEYPNVNQDFYDLPAAKYPEKRLLIMLKRNCRILGEPPREEAVPRIIVDHVKRLISELEHHSIFWRQSQSKYLMGAGLDADFHARSINELQKKYSHGQIAIPFFPK